MIDLGYTFRDPELLRVALTHRSYAHEHGGPDYERLEFLGDAVLQLAVTALLYERYPDSPEGELSHLRQLLVREGTLHEIGEELGLREVVRLGGGIRPDGMRSILADVVEALLGAAYLDGGPAVADALARRWIGGRVSTVVPRRTEILADPINRLQELTQDQFGVLPEYEVERVGGEDHAPLFLASVRVIDRVVAHEEGTNKQHAKRKAALRALEILREGA